MGFGQRETPVVFFFFIFIGIALVLDLHLFTLLDGIPYGSRLPYTLHSRSDGKPCIYPFCVISTKTLFLGWMDFYVHKPLSTLLNEIFHLNQIMSADFVSALHVVFSVISVKFIASESLSVRRFGFAIFEFGTMLDSLDGVIAKANQPQAYNLTVIASASSSSPSSYDWMLGYLVDGICDGIGINFLMAACVVYMQYTSRAKRNYAPLNTVTVTSNGTVCGCGLSCCVCEQLKKDKEDDGYNSENDNPVDEADKPFPPFHRYYWLGKFWNLLKIAMNDTMKSLLKTCRTIRDGCSGGPGFPAVLCGFQMLLSTFFWNRSILYFVDVMEHPENQGLPPNVATESVHSAVMWMILFCWRIINPLALAEYVLFAIFVNRMEGLVKYFQYSGFIIVGAVAVVSEVHRADLNRAAYANATS